VPVSYGKYVVSHSAWTLLRVELMCLSLCNDSKTPKFGHLDPVNLYNIVEYKQGQFDFLINKYKYTL
jgi:hypothetical protein